MSRWCPATAETHASTASKTRYRSVSAEASLGRYEGCFTWSGRSPPAPGIAA
jgi:hypothetical protein